MSNKDDDRILFLVSFEVCIITNRNCISVTLLYMSVVYFWHNFAPIKEWRTGDEG